MMMKIEDRCDDGEGKKAAELKAEPAPDSMDSVISGVYGVSGSPEVLSTEENPSPAESISAGDGQLVAEQNANLKSNSRVFKHLLVNTVLAGLTGSFVWFSLVFWVYLTTESVLISSMMSGGYIVLMVLSGLFFGNIVDQNKKKRVMFWAGLITLVCYASGYLVLMSFYDQILSSFYTPFFWVLLGFLTVGTIVGNLRGIALSTTVSLLFAPDKRAKANGLVGIANGVTFAITSVFSGLVIGFFGIETAILIAVILMILTLLDLLLINIPEKNIKTKKTSAEKFDIKSNLLLIKAIPGLFALIFYTTFNNFLGGVYAALMDPYGLSLVPVEVWGMLWAALSTFFIIGGLLVSKFGLGKNPLKTLFAMNIVGWLVSIVMMLNASIWLLVAGLAIYMILVPFIEAAEQTIIQKVVPFEKQGRVFGVAQSIESAATPLTTFMIGPIAEFVFIPFMTTGAGVALIGDWFGVGMDRGIALIFICAGIIGFIVTVLARRSGSFKKLVKHYREC